MESRGATVMRGQAKCSFGIAIYRLAMQSEIIDRVDIFYIVIPVKQWYGSVLLCGVMSSLGVVGPCQAAHWYCKVEQRLAMV